MVLVEKNASLEGPKIDTLHSAPSMPTPKGGLLYRGVLSGSAIFHSTLETLSSAVSFKVADRVHKFVLGNLPTACFTGTLCWGLVQQALGSEIPLLLTASITLLSNSVVSLCKLEFSEDEEVQAGRQASSRLRKELGDFNAKEASLIKMAPFKYEGYKLEALGEIKQNRFSLQLAHLNLASTALSFSIFYFGSLLGFNLNFASKSLYAVFGSSLAAYSFSYFKIPYYSEG